MYHKHVIHLRKSAARRKNVTRMQKSLGGSLTIFEAIDGSKLDDADLESYKARGYLDELKFDYITNRPLTKHHMAIWLSHVLLWERLANMQNPPKFHLIFEDDVEILPGFKESLDKYIKKLDGHVNILHLYLFDYQKFKSSKIVTKTFDGLAGMQCYLVRHSVLKRLVQKIKPMTSAIDEQLSRLKIGNYYINDDFVRHGAQCKSENRYVYM